ncbi:hypothetical protein PU629_06285 [Pullulanibacillus sp. KACC 23026]|uniref:hypothetical protein n=1 Tax=Pullulanibacillus sp. KACC 23026 TaxID=3028315 RepID=UPI0023B17347|nr:hypothetical protein [Pullulanibacillus sp. KACC 23026]WEG13972.1 hypothetical protein PU629_06285 [Pullulanibacillus sp. KACC 23026]
MKIFCFINGYGPQGLLEAVALSEDGQIVKWCFTNDVQNAQVELLNRRKYPSGSQPIWVFDKSKDVGYKKALKKHEEVQYAKSVGEN